MEERRGAGHDAPLSGEEDLWNDDESMIETVELAGDARKRYIMLACACLLGLGSHFGAYVLGPIKSSLKTTESSFAALIASFELLNTVTPLLSGFLVPRFGAAKVGLVATGIVLVGQLVVCLSQGEAMNMAGTICGLLLFGGGISPVSVVQETIILSNNTTKSSSVGRSVALGLVLGKTSSFIAGASSDWLHTISPRMPFVAASAFALTSFLASIIYARTEASLSRSAPSTTTFSRSIHKHGPINLASYATFGDPFWLYISICFFAGTWYTTIHLSTNLLQAVYDVGQRSASEAASVLLLSPTFLYPLVGWLLDRRPELMSTLYIGVPASLACSLAALIFISAAVPYTVVLLGAAACCGIGPLLSVLVVPRIVKPDQASAALALHKSLEMSGGIIFQTLSGFLLFLSTTTTPDSPEDTREDPDSTLFFLLFGSLIQLGLVSAFWGLMRRRGLDPPCLTTTVDDQGKVRSREASVRMRVSTERLRRPGETNDRGGEYGLLSENRSLERLHDGLGSEDSSSDLEDQEGEEAKPGEAKGVDELMRGKRCLVVAGGTIVSSWLAFASNLVL